MTEFFVHHQFTVQGQIGFNTRDDHFRQSDLHAGDGRVTIVTIGNQFADHRIVIRRHVIARINVAVKTDAGAARCMPSRHSSRTRNKCEGVFGVDTALDSMAANLDVALFVVQTFAVSHTNLFTYKVNTGNEFCHRMFNLNTGVHFDEVELFVFVQEFKRTGTAITDSLTGFDATFAHFFNQFTGHAGSRGFFQNLLVAALHGAIALTQVNGIVEVIGQDLNFDVARIFQEFFHVYGRVAESRLSFLARHGNSVNQCRFSANHAHAASAAATAGFNNDRVADLAGNLNDFVRIFRQGTVRARNNRNTGFNHGFLGRDLVTHDTDGIRTGTDKGKTGTFHALGKVGIFR